MFVQLGSSNHKGSVAELAIAKEAGRLGLGVLWPIVEHGRYDLAIDIGHRLLRIQCKWAKKQGDVVALRFQTSRHTPLNGYVTTTYSSAEIDAIAAYCQDLDRCYLLPAEQIEGRSAMHLRLRPARNNQLAAVHSAADYEFEGAVAQLARATGWQPVGQEFESPQLHEGATGLQMVGADAFSAHSARFMHRAAAGEEFLITRRGRPMARLLPADFSDQFRSDVRPSLLDSPLPDSTIP